jgi:hypothetical protein
MFHVELPALWQVAKDRVHGVQRCDEQLRRQTHDFPQEPLEVSCIEFGGWVIHKQGRDARPQGSVMLELPQQHRGGQQFLLASGHPVARRLASDLY